MIKKVLTIAAMAAASFSAQADTLAGVDMHALYDLKVDAQTCNDIRPAGAPVWDRLDWQFYTFCRQGVSQEHGSGFRTDVLAPAADERIRFLQPTRLNQVTPTVQPLLAYPHSTVTSDALINILRDSANRGGCDYLSIPSTINCRAAGDQVAAAQHQYEFLGTLSAEGLMHAKQVYNNKITNLNANEQRNANYINQDIRQYNAASFGAAKSQKKFELGSMLVYLQATLTPASNMTHASFVEEFPSLRFYTQYGW